MSKKRESSLDPSSVKTTDMFSLVSRQVRKDGELFAHELWNGTNMTYRGYEPGETVYFYYPALRSQVSALILSTTHYPVLKVTVPHVADEEDFYIRVVTKEGEPDKFDILDVNSDFLSATLEEGFDSILDDSDEDSTVFNEPFMLEDGTLTEEDYDAVGFTEVDSSYPEQRLRRHALDDLLEGDFGHEYSEEGLPDGFDTSFGDV